MNIKSYEELASRIQLDYNLNAKDLAAWARALNTSSKKRAGYFVGRLNMEHLARAIVFFDAKCAICGFKSYIDPDMLKFHEKIFREAAPNVPIEVLYHQLRLEWGELWKLTFDHFIPISRGGKNVPWNIILMCKSCNSKKGAKLPIEWINSLNLKDSQSIKTRIDAWFTFARSSDWGLRGVYDAC